jgi:hypothetical protein
VFAAYGLRKVAYKQLSRWWLLRLLQWLLLKVLFFDYYLARLVHKNNFVSAKKLNYLAEVLHFVDEEAQHRPLASISHTHQALQPPQNKPSSSLRKKI